jgi:hypothetical protein
MYVYHVAQYEKYTLFNGTCFIHCDLKVKQNNDKHYYYYYYYYYFYFV